MKHIFAKMFDNAMALNKQNILSLLEKNPDAKLLDLGCDDGTWTLELAKKIGTKNITGVDVVEERLQQAKKNNIMTKNADINKPLPFNDASFDVVHANQVIEHVSNLDVFASEIFRVLRPKGYIIISTENASSWHNIFAATMGWQIFSLTNVSSKKGGIGNPLAIHKGKDIELSSWTHKTIFNYRGLKEFFKAHGFKNMTITGAGYYPFFAVIGKIDVRHSHFITLKGRK